MKRKPPHVSSLRVRRGEPTKAKGKGVQGASIATMQRLHGEKLRLCKALESIADALPNVDRFNCLVTANSIVPLLRDTHLFEETVIFPVYEDALTLQEADFASIRRLRTEHIEDECFADEVTEQLLGIGHGRPVENAEALGFMLRGFFESLRRHVAFEHEHVMPRVIFADPQTRAFDTGKPTSR